MVTETIERIVRTEVVALRLTPDEKRRLVEAARAEDRAPGNLARLIINAQLTPAEQHGNDAEQSAS